MYHSQVNEYKYEIERLNRELQELKSKYYQLRKKHQLEKRSNPMKIKRPDLYPMFDEAITPGEDKLGIIPSTAKKSRYHDLISRPSIKAILPNMVAGPRFSGGGFNMSAGNTSLQTGAIETIPIERLAVAEDQSDAPISQVVGYRPTSTDVEVTKASIPEEATQEMLPLENPGAGIVDALPVAEQPQELPVQDLPALPGKKSVENLMAEPLENTIKESLGSLREIMPLPQSQHNLEDVNK